MKPDQAAITRPAVHLSHRDLDACTKALPRLYAPTLPGQFPRHLHPILSDLVPVEHVSYNEFDKHEPRSIFTSFPKQPGVQWLFPEIQHFYPLLAQSRQIESKKKASTRAVRQIKDTTVFRDYYRQSDAKYQMLCFLRWDSGSGVVLALNRSDNFSERDRSVLTFLSPHIRQAYQNACIALEQAVSLERLGEGLGGMGRAVVLTDAGGRIQWQSSLGAAWLKEFFPDSQCKQQLPLLLKKQLARTERMARVGRPNFSELRLPTRGGQRLLMLCGKTGDGGFVITLMRERERIDATMTRSFGLTPREAEILYWLSEAKTNPEIAAITGAGVRTVHKHVEHLFAKLEVENRLQAQRLGWELRRTS